ncbi:MAG: Fic family protein [Chloroflexi bacterium]|nr:Fic family protein [Chloroflexota bacterium]
MYRLDEASRSVATLAGVGETIPNPHLLIRPFIRREAVLSSKLEGTQASLSDLFMYEASGIRRGDVIEVVNYIRALELGIDELSRIPISVRLVNKLHARLLEGARGEKKRPGNLRSEQVWIGAEGTQIGEARFVPPPPDMVRDLMLNWEQFVNEETATMPPLIQCALMHYQFEAIHPYLDGNGRLGRLLITLYLWQKKILLTPLLYLSAYFERNRTLYYDQLYNLSATGRWENWIVFFLDGVLEQSRDALRRVRRMRRLQDEYRRKLQDRHESGNALRLLDELFAAPVITAPGAARLLGITDAGARGILERLASAGIVQELRLMWPRHFVAQELLDAIDKPEVVEQT